MANALPAVSNPGLPALFGGTYLGQYFGSTPDTFRYGLLPTVVGTVYVAGIALLLALPVSMAMAIISTEFPMGPLGRVIRPLVGLFSGIPPIVYAMSVVVFIQAFMIPKFAGDSNGAPFNPAQIGANTSTWPPADVPHTTIAHGVTLMGAMPWSGVGFGGNSVLLGGILIAMLLIPFMTPMIADAIRNVPSSAREASLALGANRAYTLRKAILPSALPGISTAVILGALKAIGDVVIVSFAVGWEADKIPNPIFDVLERTTPLGAQGANMVTLFEDPTGLTTTTPQGAAAGYMCALVLLLVAAAMILLMSFLKARWRRRMSA